MLLFRVIFNLKTFFRYKAATKGNIQLVMNRDQRGEKHRIYRIGDMIISQMLLQVTLKSSL